MAANITYHEQTDIDNIRKLREVLKTLPAFAKDYFRAIEPTTSTKTRISYAYDIRIFFQFLISQNPSLAKIGIPNLNVSVLDQLKPIDIEEYMEYLKLYDSPNDQTTITNGERGLKRKISSLRSFYTYYYKRQAIETNPVQLVDMPKIHDKAIIRLDAGETAALLDYIEHCGDQLTGQRKAYYEKTKLRDLAIVTLLLGTGIRVSECVGLDVEDIDFRNNGIRLIRKGGSEMVVYFGPEVEKALKDYLESRKAISPLEGHEHALFYSTQRKRIGVQAVENLVKKYARAITTTKKITPHKLRSTYGTTLYQETGDIYLVADVLGQVPRNLSRTNTALGRQPFAKAQSRRCGITLWNIQVAMLRIVNACFRKIMVPTRGQACLQPLKQHPAVMHLLNHLKPFGDDLVALTVGIQAGGVSVS